MGHVHFSFGWWGGGGGGANSSGIEKNVQFFCFWIKNVEMVEKTVLNLWIKFTVCSTFLNQNVKEIKLETMDLNVYSSHAGNAARLLYGDILQSRREIGPNA